MSFLILGDPGRSYRSYVILFPNWGKKLFLVKSHRHGYWELPGGGAEHGDNGSTWHSKGWKTMEREWREETGKNLPRINAYKKLSLKNSYYNIGVKYYYIARSSSSINLPSNGQVYGDGSVHRWTLMTVDEALRRGDRGIRGDHWEALKIAKKEGYIGKHGLHTWDI